jgi:hypothetical protein
MTMSPYMFIATKYNLRDNHFIFFGYIPRRFIAGSYGSSIINFFRKPLIPFSSMAALIYILTDSVH